MRWPLLLAPCWLLAAAGEEEARTRVARWSQPVVMELISLEGGGDAPVG